MENAKESLIDFSKITKRLKASREDLGYSLNDISEATKIQLEVLVKLEENRTEELPPFVFIRGFLQLYAEFIGLGRDWVDSEIKKQQATIKQKAQAATKSNKKRVIHFKEIKKSYFLLFLFFLFITSLSLYFYYQETGWFYKKSSTEFIDQKEQTNNLRSTISKLKENPSLLLPSQKLKIVIYGKQDGWIRIKTGREEAKEFFLKEGNKVDYILDQKLYKEVKNINLTITMSHIDVAKFYYNGKPLVLPPVEKKKIVKTSIEVPFQEVVSNEL